MNDLRSLIADALVDTYLDGTAPTLSEYLAEHEPDLQEAHLRALLAAPSAAWQRCGEAQHLAERALLAAAQRCVAGWTDAQVVRWAERHRPALVE